MRREPDLYIPSTIKTIFIRSLLITIAELDPAIDLHSCSFIIPANYMLEWMGLNILNYDGLQAGMMKEHECIWKIREFFLSKSSLRSYMLLGIGM